MIKRKSTFRHRLEQAVVSRVAWLFSLLAQRVSLRALRGVADAAAGLVMALFQRRQRLAEANIAAAFPEMSASQRTAVRHDSVRSICRTMLELLKLPSIGPAELAELIVLKDFEPVRAALAEGHGLIVVTGHFGNWEWLGARLAQEGSVAVVARDAPHTLTASLINQARQRHGLEVVGREDTRQMLRILRNGGILGIVPDQHALRGGVLVDFLGRPCWTSTGPALLAARTGARLFPAFCRRLPDGTFEAQVLPEIKLVDTGDREADLITNTRLVNEAIENEIRAYPEQWLWMHDRWKKAHLGEQAD